MEHTSELVEMGKLIHETSYPQRSYQYQEIEIGQVKIDYYDARDKVVHEIKKSDKLEESHRWQLKYYLYIIEQSGIEGVTGILEYPALRKTEEIFLTNPDRAEISAILQEIELILDSDHCPPGIARGRCKSCSYGDFCWIGEDQ